MGISQSLPQTGYVKMIDIWMIFTMSYPFFVIACYCGIEVFISYLKLTPYALIFLTGSGCKKDDWIKSSME